MSTPEDNRQERAAIGRMVFDAALAIIVAATGWYVSIIYGEIKDLKVADTSIRAEISQVRERTPIEYVRRDEYRTDVQDIKRLLERIEAKVDGKADRSETASPNTRRATPSPWRDGRDINR